ncbi:alpha/beta hydrolase [Microbacterium lushaniae]|nr:alpha/beta hydrolase [Microbacterium lushaniae]
MTAGGSPRPARRRGRRILAWTLGSVAGAVVLAAAGVVIWSQVGVYRAEPGPVEAVREDSAITVTDGAAGIVLTPADGGSGEGLVFIPGAKVDPWAYAPTLAGAVAEDGLTVVITRPWLGVAFFDLRPLATFTGLAPDVSSWAVGGHSLGGVRACQLATEADALVLFASYCANDLGDSGLPVLSVSGSEDGLSTPEKIAEAAGELPADAVFVDIPGASHASFGAYGPQDGDGSPTISDAAMAAALTDALADFLPAG